MQQRCRHGGGEQVPEAVLPLAVADVPVGLGVLAPLLRAVRVGGDHPLPKDTGHLVRRQDAAVLEAGEQPGLQLSPHREADLQAELADRAAQRGGLLDVQQPALDCLQPAGQRQQEQGLGQPVVRRHLRALQHQRDLRHRRQPQIGLQVHPVHVQHRPQQPGVLAAAGDAQHLQVLLRSVDRRDVERPRERCLPDCHETNLRPHLRQKRHT